MAGLYRDQVNLGGEALKIQQRLWNKDLRACKDEECLSKLYKSRIEELSQLKNQTQSIEIIIVRKFKVQRDYSIGLTADRIDYNQTGMEFILTGDIGTKAVEFVKSSVGKPIIVNYIMVEDCRFCIIKVTPYVK